MSMSDEARYRPKKKTKKQKKSFSQTFIPHKGDSSSEILSKIIALLSIAVVIVCLVILGKYFYEILEAKQNHNTLKTIYKQAQQSSSVSTPAPDASISNDSNNTEDKAEEQRPPLTVLSAASELLGINPDTVGYINIPGCVDEPVVHRPDDKLNEYYLDHNFYGNKRQCGTCFVDYRCNVHPYERTDNVVLYAHNQKDGTMFGNLDYYRWDPAYWLKNPFIYFNTNYTEDTYVIISSFVVNTKPEHDNNNPVFDYQNYINFTKNYPFDTFISEVSKRSTIITGIDCTEDDKYLTLSTCSTEWDDSRHIIVARKLRDDETTASIDTTKFSKNPNPKWPAIYYKYNGGTYIDE
ncbi:MAG: class B sortase [Huintestinicola sp.]